MSQSSDSEDAHSSNALDLESPSFLAHVASIWTAVGVLCSLAQRQPLHNSAFTGRQRLDEWYRRHSDGMRAWLGVEPDAFNFLLNDLVKHGGLTDTQHLKADERLTIFLYICRNGSGVRQAAEAFQRSLQVTARSFRAVLECITSLSFYSRWVRFPGPNDPPSTVITRDPRFAKWFSGCIGAIDGTHISVSPPVRESTTYRTRKGSLSMNVLAAASFDFKFIYVLSGWEGSAHDGRIWAAACADDLVVPEGRFLLADAGFGTCRQLLVPFRGVRYHLQEWAKSRSRPRTAKELYNLRHSSARNVIERIFGVAKRRWRILKQGCEYDLETQARVVYAIAVLHNALRAFEYPSPEPIPTNAELRRSALRDPPHTEADNREEQASAAFEPPSSPTSDHKREKAAAELWRGEIAQSMWRDYVDASGDRSSRRNALRSS